MAEEEQATKADVDVDNKNGTSVDGEEDDDEDEEENEEKEAVSHSFKVHEFHNLKIFRRLTAAFIGKRGRLTNFFKYVAKMDSNGDGEISIEEFSSCLKKVFKKEQERPSNQEIEDIYNLIDQDGEGKVPIGDFLTILRGPMNQDRLMYINMAFDKVDESQDGFIDAKEALSHFHQSKDEDENELESSKEEARKFIEEFDTKEIDGRVSWQEFHEFYWNVSITCNEDEEFRKKILVTWSLTEEEEQIYKSHWIPQNIFPQKFPVYCSGASAVGGVHIPAELLGRGAFEDEVEVEETDTAQLQPTPTKPDGEKPSFESPRSTIIKDVDVTALQDENVILKAQLQESRECVEKLLAILSK